MPFAFQTDPKYATNLLYRQIDQENPEAGNRYLSQEIGSLVNSQMPEFQKSLQSIRESALSRGVANGGLGTSYEGDLASAFQRNIADAAGKLSYQNYNDSRNRLLDLLSGQRDYETAEANRKRQKKGGLFGGLGSLLGGVGGFLLGGPAGAAAGSEIGGAAGRGIGG